MNKCINKKYKSNEICNGELKPKIDFFKQDGENEFKKIQKNFKKMFGKPLEVSEGYNCIECGACYDENFKRESYNMAWLGGKK